jgi:hypothetical protein
MNIGALFDAGTEWPKFDVKGKHSDMQFDDKVCATL